MASYPYVMKMELLKKFFSHIESAGVPARVSQNYLEQSGFASSNDRRLIPVLKFIDFITTDSGQPTNNWTAYRDKSKAPIVLGTAIKKGYKDLFELYPDAHRKDDEAIRNFLRGNTNVQDKTIGLMVGTFKTFCEMADFDDIDTDEGDESGDEKRKTKNKEKKEPKAKIEHSSGVVVNINIQIGVPATENEEIYDKFFASLKKHLL